MPARWMLYSHDTLGLGHVRRTIAIARAVIAGRSDLSALLVTCSPMVDSLPMPPGLDYMKLPSASKAGPGEYEPRTLAVERERFCGLRAAALRETCAAFSPHLLLVDKSPLGLMGELTDALAALHSSGQARMVVGWRDILDSPAAVHDEWQRQGTLDVLERRYDEIWVYGDPEVFDVRERYHLPPPIADRVHHLGYLAPRITDHERARVREALNVNGEALAVVTVGGGEGGERVLETYLEAGRRHLLPTDMRTVVVTGPFMPEATRRRLAAGASSGTRVMAFVPGLEHLIAAADVVIGRAGYNTVCEAFGGETPAVLVPRVLHRDEQVIRARRFAELGLAEVVEEPELMPWSLAEAVRRGLWRRRPVRPPVKLDGLEEVRRRVLGLLPGVNGPGGPSAPSHERSVRPAVVGAAEEELRIWDPSPLLEEFDQLALGQTTPADGSGAA